MAVDKTIRILVVDDQDAALELMRDFLRQFGFRNIEMANSAITALQKLREFKGDVGLILSDWNMHSVSGLQLLQAIRKEPGYDKTPFIMITGEASRDRIEAALKAGVTSYIAKPFSLDALKKRLVGILGEF
ncbi:MAG TPA: response regulator [Magnetospirillaceae bacterium]|jgi:two-component system chemotaxis response regulator CheY